MSLFTDGNVLSWATFFPLIGAAVIVLLMIGRAMLGLGKTLVDQASRWIALVTSGLSMLAAIAAWSLYDPKIGGVQLVAKAIWIRDFNVEYFVGADGISISMVLLSGLISFIATIASMPWWGSHQANDMAGMHDDGHDDPHHPKHFSVRMVPGYMAMLLLLQTGMMGTFAALDMFLFYVFWEVMLLPMYFLIGVWGGPRKEYAAIKFFLYTLAGSVLMLLAIIALYYTSQPALLADGTMSRLHTFNIIEMGRQAQAGVFAGAAPILGFAFTKIVFIGLFIGFAIKIPMFPFHTWLPDAHVEAPTPISVILAGVLLKMGIYGILRFNYAILPDATAWAANAIAVFGVINIVYAAFVCLAQKDLKKLIAYSSVSHMGFSLLGMAAMTPQGISGAVLNLFTHGIISPMLFLIVGVIYDRAHHREIEKLRRPGHHPARVHRHHGAGLLRVAGPPRPGRLRLRVHGVLGRVPGLHHLHHHLGHLGDHHRGLLPVGHPPDVPRQAQHRLRRLPRPGLARAAHPVPAGRLLRRPRVLSADDPLGGQRLAPRPDPEHPPAVAATREPT